MWNVLVIGLDNSLFRLSLFRLRLTMNEFIFLKSTFHFVFKNCQTIFFSIFVLRLLPCKGIKPILISVNKTYISPNISYTRPLNICTKSSVLRYTMI